MLSLRHLTGSFPGLLLLAIVFGWVADRAAGHYEPDDGFAMDQATGEVGDQAFFELADLRTRREGAGRPYLPFMDVPTLRYGLICS
jgi:hypothetical protein